MTENLKEKDKSDRQEWDPQMLLTGTRVLAYFPRVGTGLIGLAVFAYLIGWLHAKAYFSQFGATWLLSELTSTEFLSFSTTSLTFIGIILLNVLLNLTESPPKLLVSNKVYISCSMLSVIGPLVSMMLLNNNRFSLAMIASYLAAVGWSLSGITLLYKAIELISNHGEKGQIKSIGLLVLSLIFGFYFVPTTLGEAQGKRDVSSASLLPEIVPKDNALGQLRLLRAKGDIFYAARIAGPGNPVEIHLLSKEQLALIRPYSPSPPIQKGEGAVVKPQQSGARDQTSAP